ncbi:MAG: phosphate/phosphite/phosphonate ABC transporter substrate-binding protein [Deltaproteobacteria bacterium]|nr:phosphate/phosphite/phosphonate ABC transporter substrate-binding protein [Deltaproteobacteria bacterium]MCZ6622547.1 phosphate/phosphite/phosphonate ABC transporter substrate-binding protein [Deltaproteobacteria bacterium]
MIQKWLLLGFLLLLPLGALTCSKAEEQRQVLRVGFVPAENAQQVALNAQPIVLILQKELGLEIQSFVATDYTGVVEALRANKLDIAFLTPASYVLAKAEANVKVVLKSHRRGRPYYYAAIITHVDSGIGALEDLRNKTFAFGDPLSTSGHIFPRKMFEEKGINPVKDFKKVIFSGGHDATVLAVLNHKVDAGATFANFPDGKDAAWTQYLKDPKEQKKIRAIAYSEPIPSDNLVVSANLDPRLTKKIVNIFLDLSKDPAGKKMLRDLYKIDGFIPATDRDYDSVREAFKIAGIDLKEELNKKRP